MAVEVESTSQVEEFLRVLKKRVWWIIIPFVLISTLGAAFAVIVPKKYVAMTRVMVRDEEDGEQSMSYAARQSQEGKVAKHVIRAPRRIRAVLAELRWPEWLEKNSVEQFEYLEGISEALEVQTPAMSAGSRQQVVGIYFAHTNPQSATQFVQLLFEKWKTEVLERGKNQAVKVFETVKQQRAELQKSFDTLTEEIIKLRTDYEIAPPEANRQGVANPSGPTLWDKIAQDELSRVQLEDDIESAEIALAELRDEHAKMDDQVLDLQEQQGVNYQRQIGLFQTEIMALNQELQREGYKVLHPRHKQIKTMIEALQEQITFYEAAETAGGTQQNFVTNYDKLDLADQIESDQKAIGRKKGTLQRIDDQLVAAREKARQLNDIVEKIYKLADERSRVSTALEKLENEYQSRLAHMAGLESASSNPFEVLEPVTQPTNPTEPNPVLIVLFSVFAGLALGLALAVITEYSRSCFRSVHDITRVMVVPVLGTVNGIVTKGQVRRRMAARFVMGGATLAFVFVVGFVTWAWAMDQRFLSAGMVDTIENVREALK
ncbi:MAG: hypothetical protein GY711_32800 [bacterium]|nr:hypothetical protein [bacterium]